MGTVRKAEAIRAAAALGVQTLFLEFADLGLSFIPFEILVKAVLEIVRGYSIDVLASFHPHDVTPEIDHPDHTTAGNIARFVSAVADVAHFMPEVAASLTRPELWLWTSRDQLATEVLELNPGDSERFADYLLQQYPSQFEKNSQHRWQQIFDRIRTTTSDNRQLERYQRVR